MCTASAPDGESPTSDKRGAPGATLASTLPPLDHPCGRARAFRHVKMPSCKAEVLTPSVGLARTGLITLGNAYDEPRQEARGAMSYRGLTVWMLISAPSDVPEDALEAVRRAVSQWNVQYGKAFGAAVVPVAWNEHATAAFGERPQGLINDQLTDQADVGLAIFRDRLGTPTGEAVSGTWEEVERMATAGKPVGVLRDRRPRSTPAASEAAAELLRLEEHLETAAFPRALVLSFGDVAQLVAHVQGFVNRAVAQLQQAVDDDLGAASPGSTSAEDDPSRGVWPRIESTESVKSDSKGRVRTHRNYYLVLSNQTGGPVRNLRYEFLLEEGALFDVMSTRNRDPIKVMPPSSESRFAVVLSWGSVRQADCRVYWEDDSGEHTTEATVVA